MSELRPFPRTPRALIDYNYIETLLGEQVVICVPRAGYQIARDFLVASGLYVGSYYSSVDDTGFYTPTREQFDNIDQVVSEFLASEVNDMGCFEELKLSIDCLCQAIYATQTGGGSGGAGTIPAAPSSFFDNGVDIPSGYDDRADYVASKCNLSQFILNRLSGDFDRLKQVNVAGQGALALAGIVRLLMLTPIGLSQIVGAVVVAILGLAAAGIAAYVQALDELQSRMDAMDICELYEANDVAEAIANVHSWIAGGSYTLSSLTIQLGQSLIGTDALNVLFDPKSDNINYDELPVGDCSLCVLACDSGFSVERGTGPSTPNDFPMTFTSALNVPSGCHYIWVTSFEPGLKLKFTDVTGWVSCNPPGQFRVGIGGVGLDTLYSADTPPSSATCFDPAGQGDERLQFIFSGDEEFTVTLDCC